MTSPTTVAVLSDDRLFAEGLGRILGDDPLVTVIGIADEKPSAGRRQFHGVQVLLVDSRTDGALAAWAALRRPDGPKAIFVAAPGDDAWSQQALSAGARGVLTRGAAPSDLLQAVRVVHEGGMWAPRRVMAQCIERLSGGAPPSRPDLEAPLAQQLSSREREVFRHAATGLSNKELADRLAISRGTVKAHLTQIFQKLGVNGRSQLAAVYHGVHPAFRRPAADDAGPTVVRLKA